tara:strand:- start:329 stop:1363 length:1035 start_codon:yes stop_codon:yes gene_type:complete
MLFEVFEKITDCDNKEFFEHSDHSASPDTEALSTCDANAAAPVVATTTTTPDVIEDNAIEKETTAPLKEGALTGTQKMMGSVVESAVNKAKGEIDGLIPKIEHEVVKQEEEMQGQLEKAEQSLVGETESENEEKEEKVENEKIISKSQPEGPTSAQVMMGSVVESAVDKAKGQIGGLIPQIENEIVKQEKEMENQLEKAEVALTTEQNGTKVAPEDIIQLENVNEDNVDAAAQQMPTAAQKMMGNVVELAVDKAKSQIGGLIPKIEDEIVKQETEMENQLTKAEASLTRNQYEITFVVHVETQEAAEDVLPSLSRDKEEKVMDNAMGNTAEIVGLETVSITAPK